MKPAAKPFLAKAASFAAIGLVNMGVDATIFFLALRYVTTSLVVANVLGWVVAVSSSYVMNSVITFAAESGRQLRLRDYGRFAASGLLGLGANTLTLLLVASYVPGSLANLGAVWGMDPPGFRLLLAKLAAIVAGFVVNFSLTHFVVFRPARDAERPAMGQQLPSAAPSSERSSTP